MKSEWFTLVIADYRKRQYLNGNYFISFTIIGHASVITFTAKILLKFNGC